MPILNQKIKKQIILAIDIAGIFVVLSIISFFWKLYFGTINADFLKPYIIHSISSDKIPFSFEIGTVELEWGRGNRPIDITANELVIKDTNGGIWAILPKVAIVLSPQDVFKGEITPHLIDIVSPAIKVFKEKDHSFSFIVGKTSNQKKPKKMTAEEVSFMFGSFFDDSGAEKFKQKDLEFIRISNAELDFTDISQNKNINFKDVSFDFSKKDTAVILSAIINMDFLGKDVFVTISTVFDNKINEAEFGIRFNKFKPSYFAEFFPEFKNFDIPIGGSLSFAVDADFLKKLLLTKNKEEQNASAVPLFSFFSKDTIRSLDFDIYGGAGLLTLPDPIKNSYVLFSLFIKGGMDYNLNRLVFEKIEANFGEEKISFSGEILNIVDRIIDKQKDLKINFKTEIKSLELEKLSKYWPEKIARDAREWVVSNLTAGVIKKAVFDMQFIAKNDNIEVSKIIGTSTVTGATVNYLEGMPKINNVDGIVKFATNKIDINISKGATYNLNITKGGLSFYDLNEDLQKAKINLDIKGSLSDALNVADSEPLKLFSILDFDKKGITGQADINLDLAFPFIKDLKGKDVAVKVKADVTETFIPKAFGKDDLTQGKLSLLIDNDAMNIEGTATIKELLARVGWQENFNDKGKEFKSRRKIGIKLTEKDRIRLGFNVAPFVPPYFAGDMDTEFLLTNDYNGEKFLGIRADLTEALIAIPMLGWVKNKQDVANATVSARILDNGSFDITRFIVTSGEDLNVQGKFLITPKGHFDKIVFSKFIVGRTDANIIFEKTDKKVVVNVAGKAFDFNPIFKEATGFGDEKNSSKLFDMDLNVAVKKMWGSPSGYMSDVGAVLGRKKSKWHNIEVAGSFESGEKVLITLLPDEHEGHELLIETKDAGALFKTFGLLENIKSGYLRLEGYTDAVGKTEGSLRMKDYRLIKAPILARLLTMASLTGFLDILSGEGIAFIQMDLPFVYNQGYLEVKDVKTSGNSLGITAKGFIDFKKNLIDLEGFVAPAYVLSRILGNIPIIGKLIVGKDSSGVFAVSYNIKGERKNPEIIVNPLSALAPGFLRDLFDNLTKENTAKDSQTNE